MSSLAIIPARGGSKGLPGKNIKPFNDKPLIAWAIECALQSQYITDVIVSTDDQKIAEVSRSYGAQVSMRPDNLATDKAKVIDSIKYVVQEQKNQGKTYECICLLEPTAPLRDAALVDNCIEHIEKKGYNSVATFSPAPVSPNRLWKIEDGKPIPYMDSAVPWLTRQEQPEAYILNGMVYAFSPENLTNDPNQITFFSKDNYAILVKDRAGFDIDTLDEFIAVEALHKRMTNL